MTLDESLGTDLSGYTAIEPPRPASPSAPSHELQPTRNTMIRCPLPAITGSNPDSLRQFYIGGQVPQMRIYSPQ